ncbi:MAG: hypothetical protein C4558_09485 [Dehalococcoidia bacterium]|nr:MAG: hypothetical protein C4558_09485 [Dehalococcoidia bacterium]
MTGEPPAITPNAGPLGREESLAIARWLAERISRHVGIEVWWRPDNTIVLPDRDGVVHAEMMLSAMKQLASLHPALTITPYALDQFAERAQREAIHLAPTTVLRGGGKSVRLSGLISGLLFPPFLDVMTFLSAETPLQPETKAALTALPRPLDIEILLAPYDAYSGHLLRLLGAFAAESKNIRLTVIEVAEFPRLASIKGVAEVPLMTIEGRRFPGAWDEPLLMQQLWRIAVNEPELVVRERIFVTEFVTEEQVKAAEAAGPSSMPAAHEGSGGLIVPGR